MISRLHLDDQTLDRVRFDQLNEDDDAVLQHVESCQDCQQRFEQRSLDGMSWEDTAALLSEPTDALEYGSELPADETLFRWFLEPSERPDSLGRFARYEVLEFIGRGAMGVVMKVQDTALGRRCAVKVLAPEYASNAAARKRFFREAKSAAAVVHPHVVPIQTVDEHDGLPYLVMPIVEGQNLQQRVDTQGPLPVLEALRIAIQVAQGLQAAHEQGLVHRDIKPANILLENGVERVQITDFGLARAVDDASMTRSGVIAGTPQCMSPEQARGEAIDSRSDLFSLGSLLYFMLTGRSPFRAENTVGVLHRIVQDQPRALSSINESVPDWLEQIVMKLLSKHAEDRFASADQLSTVLQGWQAHLQDPAAHPPGTHVECASASTAPDCKAGGSFSKSPRRWFLAGAAFGFLLLVWGLFFVQTNKGMLRIKTNANQPVPIVIRQGDQVVEKLTVSQAGASTKLRVGQYTIELAGDETQHTIKDGNVRLTRNGTWIATIQQVDPQPAESTTATHFQRAMDALPANTQLHVAACYYPPENKNPVDVAVKPTGHPMVLVLNGYFSVGWNVAIDPAADVRAVILSGYHQQYFSHAAPPQSIPAQAMTYFPVWDGITADEKAQRAANSFYVSSPIDQQAFAKMESHLQDVTGCEISSYQSMYSGSEFTIDGARGVDELAVAKRWQHYCRQADRSSFDFLKVEARLGTTLASDDQPRKIKLIAAKMDALGIPDVGQPREAASQPTETKQQGFQSPESLLQELMRRAQSQGDETYGYFGFVDMMTDESAQMLAITTAVQLHQLKAVLKESMQQETDAKALQAGQQMTHTLDRLIAMAKREQAPAAAKSLFDQLVKAAIDDTYDGTTQLGAWTPEKLKQISQLMESLRQFLLHWSEFMRK